MRDHLTRKKRNLQIQGAINNEIKSFMGGRWNFAGMSDNALERAYNEIKGKGVPKVVNGHVYTRDYIAKSKAWYGDRFETWNCNIVRKYNYIKIKQLNNNNYIYEKY